MAKFVLIGSGQAGGLLARALRTWAGAGTMSILAHEYPKELVGKVEAASVKCDFREPNSLPAVAGHPRRADTTFMTRFHDIWRFAKILAKRQDIATRYLPDSLVAIELRPGYFCGFYRD